MAKQSVFSNPITDESHSRNAFDRSEVSHVNFDGGMLIPTFCKFVFGHSHCRINQKSFFRTTKVSRPAFTSLPVYTDYFFVPMHQIITNWNAFRSRTQDRDSSLIGVPTRLPAITDANLQQMLLQHHSNPSITDDAGFPVFSNDIRLLDLFNYGNCSDTVYYDTNTQSIVKNATGDISPLKLCAYQKIYYDHYRNTAYERNNVGAYNLDRYYNPANIANNDGIGPSPIPYNEMGALFDLHYVNYRRDYFNTVYPSLNFNAFGSGFNLQQLNTLPSSVINGFIDGLGNLDARGFGNFGGSGVNVTPYTSVDKGGLQNNVNVSYPISTQNIRAAFALEKLLRVAAFTPQHVKDQFKARFGYTPGSSTKHESVRLGSFKNEVLLQEVTSTADTGNTELGDVGGKGVGASDYEKVIEYDVPEDGIIMGITYVLPHQSYDSCFLDPINQQFVPEDWSLPEYENLGLQPIFCKNLSIIRNTSDSDANQIQRGNMIVGYQPRDMQYKASVNQNHGEFRWNRQLSPFVLHGRHDWLDLIGKTGTTGVDKTYFKCIPQDFASLFVTGGGTNDELYDQFYGQIINSFACIQDKPIFGIPKI